MDIVNILIKLANLASYGVDKDGYINAIAAGGANERVKVGEYDLVIPNKFQLSGEVDPTWKERMIFNPLAENVTQQTASPSLLQLISGVQFRINVTLMALFSEIIRVATNPEAQKGLTSDQLEFVAKLSDVDETVAKLFNTHIVARAAKTDFVFVKFFPKYVAKIGDVEYGRATLVSFPMVEELTGPRLFGNKTPVPKAASEKFVGIIRCILRDVLEKDAYSAGSNGRVAPFFESFVAAVIKVCNDIRRVQAIWPEMWNGISEPERFGAFDINWLEAFRNCDALADVIRACPNVHQSTSQGGPVSDAIRTMAADRSSQVPLSTYQPPPPSYRNEEYVDRRERRYDDQRDDRRSSGAPRKLGLDDLASAFGGRQDDRYGRRYDRRDRYDDRRYDDRNYGGTNWR